MQCNDVRQLLLDLDWTAAKLRQAAEALAHLEQCADCRKAMDDYERVSKTLKPQSPAPEPSGGWRQFEQRLLDDARPARSRMWPQLARMAAAFLLGVIAIEAYRAFPTKQPTPSPR